MESKQFVKVCPNCFSENIKLKADSQILDYICLECGLIHFYPIEIEKGKLSELRKRGR